MTVIYHNSIIVNDIMTFDKDRKVIMDDRPSYLVFHYTKFIKIYELTDLYDSKLFFDTSLKNKRL